MLEKHIKNSINKTEKINPKNRKVFNYFCGFSGIIFRIYKDKIMKRKRKIIIVAHCILNVNSKVEGLATYSGAYKSLVSDYLNNGYGIIQLPCPETTFCGLQRWGMSRNQYDHPNYRRHCREILIPVIDQIQMYKENGYSIDEIICVNGSPSCGLDTIFTGFKGGLVNSDAADPKLIKKTKGRGVFIDELVKLLNERKIKLKFKAIDEKSAIE
jgi:predicted secreted protein